MVPSPCLQIALVSKNVAFSQRLGQGHVGLGAAGREGRGDGGGIRPPELAILLGRAPWDPDTKPSMCLMELGVSLGCRFAAF